MCFENKTKMEENVVEELEQLANYSGLNSPENSVSSQHEKRFGKLESNFSDLSKEVGVLSKRMYNMEVSINIL